MDSKHTKKPASGFPLKLFMCVFALLFAAVIINSVFSNAANALDFITIIGIMAAYIAAMVLIYLAVRKHSGFFERHFMLILVISVTALFAASVGAGFALRYVPKFDLAAIYTGAAKWSETGDFMNSIDPSCDENYFYFFPNNLGGLSLLFSMFRIASVFSVTDYYAVAMIGCSALFALSAFFAVLVCRRAFDSSVGILALFMILLFPPCYLAGATFYTDSLSVLFPVLTLYLYLRYRDSKSRKGKIALLILLGLCSAVGAYIKFTVLIALIAIALYHVITRGIVKTLPILLSSALMLAVVFSASSIYFNSVHMDEQKASQLSTPFSHWIMMSLSKNGRYNGEDYTFTRSFTEKKIKVVKDEDGIYHGVIEYSTDRKAQREAIAARIGDRVREHGFGGMCGLFSAKVAIIFGDGTIGQCGFFTLTPANDTPLHSIVMDGGEFNGAYKKLCSGIFFAMLALVVASAASAVFRKENITDNRGAVRHIISIALFGVLLFFLLWEVSERYITNYILFIIIAAACGLGSFNTAINEVTNKLCPSRKRIASR